MDFRDFIAPLTLVISIFLGSRFKWNVLSVYGKDNRKIYILKMAILISCSFVGGIVFAELKNTPFNMALFLMFLGLGSSILYTSMMRRMEDIIHLSTTYKILLFVVCPVLGSDIRFVDLALNIAIVLLMFIPPKKERE